MFIRRLFFSLMFGVLFYPVPGAEIPLIAQGKARFALTGAVDSAAAKELQALAQAHYGSFFPTAQNAPDLPQIRLFINPESGDKDYAVSADEQAIAISGGSPAALRAALKRFLALAAHETLTLPDKLNIEYRFERDKIDNAKLLPAYRGRGVATLEKSDAQGKLRSPDWLKSLVMVEVRIDTASLAGALTKSDALLDFYAAMGVNALWITPIFERGPGGNGYGNVGLHRIEPALVGTNDQTAAHKAVQAFVSAAHKRNIYILFDVITWGTMKNCELKQKHPKWYEGEAWGNDAFNWQNQELRKWFIDEAVKFILESDADGFRCDCEPHHAGEEVYAKIRKKLNNAHKAVAIIAEDGTSRGAAFDFEQDGVMDYSRMNRGQYFTNPVNFFTDGYLNIIESCQRGTGLGPEEEQKNAGTCGRYRFYANCISNHDFQHRNIAGDRLKIIYAAILAPFIPIWYQGDAFGHTAPNMVIYDQTVDFSTANQPENAFFLEDVKKALAIRRLFPEIFEYFPLNHRDSNIRKLKVNGQTVLPAYARTHPRGEVWVIPNASGEVYTRVQVPLGKFTKAMDSYAEELIPNSNDNSVYVVIPPRDVAVILVEK